MGTQGAFWHLEIRPWRSHLVITFDKTSISIAHVMSWTRYTRMGAAGSGPDRRGVAASSGVTGACTAAIERLLEVNASTTAAAAIAVLLLMQRRAPSACGWHGVLAQAIDSDSLSPSLT